MCLTDYQALIKEMGYHDAVHLVKTLDQLNLTSIVTNFIPPNKKFTKPRIAFFGLYHTLSMTDQRLLCRQLGFEYYEDTAIGNQDEGQIKTFLSKWRGINGRYTKFIVIGNVLPPPRFDFTKMLYKTLKRQTQPEFIRYQIPILFESELIKTRMGMDK